MSDVDRICGMRGFAAALVSVGWLEVDESTGDVTIPLFNKHNGATAKRRASVAASARKSRAKKEQEQIDENAKTKRKHPCKQPCLQDDYLDKIRERYNINSRVSYDMCRKPPPKAEVSAAMAALMILPGEVLERCVDAYLDSRQAAGWLNAKGLSIVDWRADARAFARVYAEKQTKQQPITRRHDCNNPNDYRTN
ncbi:MAG: hypothetical protein LUE08_07325 [Akkermansiaceae bacterium]|nr:hypothetical protein [Akkermansiaceae bacterium]